MASIIYTWGTQPHERESPFPCDRIISRADDALYRGITIQAQPAVVFRWLCQLRVAPYSYDWVDNLGRPSPRELIAGLEELVVGQEMMRDFELVDFARNQHLTLCLKPDSVILRTCGEVAVSYCVIASEAGTSRLLVKMAVCYSSRLMGRLARLVLPAGDLVMMRRQLLNFKQLAERSMTN